MRLRLSPQSTQSSQRTHKDDLDDSQA